MGNQRGVLIFWHTGTKEHLSRLHISSKLFRIAKHMPLKPWQTFTVLLCLACAKVCAGAFVEPLTNCGRFQDLPSVPMAHTASINPPTPTNWTVGTKRLLFMRLTFPDDPSEPISLDAANALMTNVSRWYLEKSYGLLNVTFDVTPLLQMPRAKSMYLFRGMARFLDDARAVALTNGFDPNNYDLDIARFNQVPGWDFGGSAMVGGKGLWLQSSSPSILIHELGHNFGLEHANFWAAGADSVIGPGEHQEYGNIFDIMGDPPPDPDSLHFNTIWLHRLKWLDSSLIATVSTSGVYRLRAFDVSSLTSGATYALNIRKDESREYWAEFRQKFASNPWTQNGVLLNWSPWENSHAGTHLLDASPGSPAAHDSKDDSPLVVGRTLSDFESGIHLTPLAVSIADANRWIDVQVHLGGFSNNVAPTLALTSGASSVGVGDAVQFTASANDSDGDALAFHWDFGDLSVGPNAPSVSKSWQQAGEYSVRCTVSDMKGGGASRNLIVTVGSPAVFRISGRILDPDGHSVEGVRIHNGGVGSAYRGTYTDSDGQYSLVNLPAGSHTLTAVKRGFHVVPSGWPSPVSVGPNATGHDWVALPNPVISVVAADSSATESEGGSDTGMFSFIRVGTLDVPISIKFKLGGTAEIEDDYTLSAGGDSTPYTVLLPAGVASTNIALVPGDEFQREGTETAILTLVEDAGYTASTNSATVFITDSIGRILPYIEWEEPAEIVYGTPLGPNQLNAFTFDEGTLVYDPPAGSVLNAGLAQELKVIFTPDDPLRYESATNYVAINVAKKALSVTADDVTTVYGAPILLSASYNGFVNGDTAGDLDVPVTITTDATSSSPIGSYPIAVAGASDANYSMSFVAGTLTITRVGTAGALVSSANPAVQGREVTFTFTVSAMTPSTAVPVGMVRFTVDGAVQNLALINGVATLSTAELATGSHSILAEYLGTPNFLGTLKVLEPEQLIMPRATITWAGPADITYGAALGPGELNASTSVPGTLVYDPPIGSVLNAGSNQILSVIFTPSDTAYQPITTNVSINVLKKSLTVTAANTNQIYGAAMPAFSASYNGFVNGDTPGALDTPVMFTTSATSSSDVGIYAVQPAGATDSNYAITFASGTLNITPARTLGIVSSSSNPALPGEQVTFTFLASPLAPSTATPAGGVLLKIDGASTPVPLVNGVATFNTSTLSAGTHVIEVEYAGNANWIGTTNRLSPDQRVSTVSSPNLAITPLGNGSYRIAFDGINGVTYRIEFSSSDLSAWQTLGSVTTNGVGSFEIIDTPSPASRQRFYRAVYP